MSAAPDERARATQAASAREHVDVAQCGSDDRAEQARLFNRCFKKTLHAEALAWRYDANPCGGSVSFVARLASGEAVSGYACSPRRAVPDGDPAQAAVVGETGDVMTHPDWRGRGYFSALDRACMEEIARRGWPLAFGLPNRKSAHIFLELGWEDIGRLRPWTFVLRADDRARRDRAGDGRLAAWLTGIDRGRGARAREAVRASIDRGGSRSIVREIARFPDDVGELSRRVEPSFGFMIHRDAAYLNWRFADAPSRAHTILGGFDASGRLQSYAVVELPRGDSPTGYLVDVLAADPNEFDAAVEAGLARIEAAGASLVRATAIDGTAWQQSLARVGFLPRHEKHELIVILCPRDAEHALVRAARDVTRWYFTDGDRDDETMG